MQSGKNIRLRITAFLLSLVMLMGCITQLPASAEQIQAAGANQTELSSVATGTEISDKTLNSDEFLQLEPQDTTRIEHVARLHDEETLDTHVYLNNDGSRTLYFYDHPVQYMDAQGKRQDISLDIADTTDAKYPFRTKANSAVTSFPASLSDGIKLSGNGVDLRLAARLPIGAGKNQAVRRLDSQTVSYTYDANTTIEYSLTYTGFKEDIVVNSYTGQTEYSFTLYTNGLILTKIADSYYLTDDAGMIRASIGEVIVFTADERNNALGQMRVETIEHKQQYSLTIVLNPEYLADPKTVYPIRIDPTITLNYASEANAVADVNIHSNHDSGGERTYLILGLAVSGISRILIKFPGIDFSEYAGVTITSATVSLRDLMCEGTQLPVTCHAFTGSDWEEATASWDTVTQSWGEALDSRIMSYSIGATVGHRYEFNVREAVQKWVDGDPTITPEKGLIFKADDTIENGTVYEYRTLGSYERSSYKPVFTMTYQSAITLSQTSGTVYTGESLALTATTAPAGQAVTWSSDAPAVAAVDENGVVTGLAAGTATITAVLEEGMVAECEVIVLEKVIDFRYNINTEVYKGNTITLIPYVEPANEPITWTSLQPEIASVDQTGEVTGISVGVATIRAALTDGTSADLLVEVLPTNIYFNCGCGSDCADDCTCGCTDIDLYVGEQVTLTATTVPPGLPVTWVSLDAGVAAVADGVVTAVSAGETIIRAYLDESTFAECAVSVNPWQVNWDETSIKIAVGDTHTFSATTTPIGKNITWSSSDSTIATVNQFGEVNALKFGDVTITATLSDGTSESCLVRVRYRGSLSYPVIDLIAGEGRLLMLGTEAPIEITWTSTDSNIATVNENGYVQGKNPGIVRITASSPDLLEPVTCRVDVRLMRGMYTLKNISSNLQMAAKNYGIASGTRVIQQVSASEHTAEAYSKIWKIYYLDNGYYSIRPAHKLDLCLFANGNDVYLSKIGTAQDSSSLSVYAQWSITVTAAGDLIIKNRVYSDYALMPTGGSNSAGTLLKCDSTQGMGNTYIWRYSGITVSPKILFYNSNTGTYLENPRKGMVPGDLAFTLAQLNIVTSVVSNTSNDQSGVLWLPVENEEIAQVHGQTGTVTITGTYGEAVVTAMKSIDGDFRYASYTVVVSRIRITGYEIEYNEALWSSPNVKIGTNCYSYALNCQTDEYGNILKLLPGQAKSGEIMPDSANKRKEDYPNEKTIIDYIMDDVEMYNFYFMECSAVDTPPEGAYRVALFVSPGKFFHWYRQNPDGTWSHKLGSGSVYNCDADGNPIYDPYRANRNYGGDFYYRTLIGYFYVTPLN